MSSVVEMKFLLTIRIQSLVESMANNYFIFIYFK